jgi:hypothetical protein
VGHLELVVEKGSVYSILVGEWKGKKPLGRPRPRTRMILKYVLKK